MKRATLLLPNEYVAAATKQINRARTQVSFLCMMVTDDMATDELIDALAAAARRGVKVRVAADTFTYGELGGHFIPFKYYSKTGRAVSKMANDLTAAGVEFTWLGRLALLPVTGRTHSKCLVVDDAVFSFGGVNLYDESLNYTDFMFEWKDQDLATRLNDEITHLIDVDRKNSAYRSHSFAAGEHTTILIDGGLQGDSIIYRRAVNLAREATSIVFVSQYCPSGRLQRAMKQKKAAVYFNPPSNATFWNSIIIRTGQFFSRQKNRYRKKKYLHAKFIIFTMSDGQKVALTGSHNFVPGTVLFGTKEIAIETRDTKIIDQLESFFTRHVK